MRKLTMKASSILMTSVARSVTMKITFRSSISRFTCVTHARVYVTPSTTTTRAKLFTPMTVESRLTCRTFTSCSYVSALWQTRTRFFTLPRDDVTCTSGTITNAIAPDAVFTNRTQWALRCISAVYASIPALVLTLFTSKTCSTSARPIKITFMI